MLAELQKIPDEELMLANEADKKSKDKSKKGTSKKGTGKKETGKKGKK